ncbi:heme o synthase [Thiohalomonas denitrificans]|uniref:Protoheme IX farnesyltransferase n=1 Tax=Thiohalomonas denitrificans TaxID=415747 RepID=A0A1G5PVI1_9GAMM|nr:heme o synthase [Thiohalomonas denitrificans]SCZ53574.1 protoheme IX farnesyltransferase [Thiohalomonas denitrificans]
MPLSDAVCATPAASWRRYLSLTKPRIVGLMLFTALVGMFLAIDDSAMPWSRILFGLLGIGLAAGAGAVINHLLDAHIDAIMERTRHRPMPSGQIGSTGALGFALILAVSAMAILTGLVNVLTAALTFTAMIGYAVLYTAFLKRSTPQNIVWGGAAGASPPLLGAAAVTGEVTLDALLLSLIIFVWTPPHFWPLAIHRVDDYRHAKIPMLPVTHGLHFTKTQVLLYSIMLMAVALLPFVTRSAGILYLLGVIPLGLGFIWHAWRLYRGERDEHAMVTFRYSILYLFGLFALLLADHWAL